MATRAEYQEALRVLKAKDDPLTPGEEVLVERLEQHLKAAKPRDTRVSRAKKAAK